MDGGDVPGRAVERRRDGGEHPRELPLGHWPGSMLDRSSVRPAGPSAGAGAAGGGGGAWGAGAAGGAGERKRGGEGKRGDIGGGRSIKKKKNKNTVGGKESGNS